MAPPPGLKFYIVIYREMLKNMFFSRAIGCTPQLAMEVVLSTK